MIFQAKNIKKTYGDLTVLENLSFEVDKNEIAAILGPSGIGKSTLLKCIVQLESIDSGSFILNGETLTEKNRTQVGLVFQSSSLFQHKNVLENLLMAPRYHKLYDDKELLSMADSYLQDFGLLDKKFAYPSELSGGQKQRIAIIRALLLKPLLLCFDEPTSSLDQENKMLLLDILQKIKKDHAILIVSHDEDFIEKIADTKIQLR
ncbi:ATP-binding cassette domain-containing protein [Proteiniclasticum ruminis]|uniref:Polar amino acid transport system ATP-binding protein n=1 Tax=Proteiniclasticum ruminis TaxID=398199 RepID=A0A1G8Q6W4_9CLOT|nr:ATP-binding cassette domain-containing protein [Proteiniclasticum ruminis]SDJ00451.1 polar amino acid transport system ATP-binding protein [Proteiniclasticum ruminis]